jgi:hypothetical protein
MIFLARNGRVSGPFSEAEISKLRQQGELERYSWMWNSRLAKWEPLDPPPPPLVKTGRIEAICHDSHQVVSGVLDAVSESGCQLVTSAQDASPLFSPSSILLLNLLDPATGESMNVRARFASAARKSGQWHYRLQWDEYPALLLP